MSGSVTGKQRVAGIAASMTVASTVISGCYSNVTVNGVKWCGGIAGFVSNGEITDCYNLGAINASGTAGMAGGIASCGTTVPMGAKITNCYNAGKVTAPKAYGSITASTKKNVVTNSYFLQGSCDSTTINGILKTKAEMLVIAETLGSSFKNSPDNGNNLPVLSWECNNHLGHIVVDDGDCTTELVCKCGCVIKDAKDCHEYEEEFLYNENGHYHKCKNCDQTSTVVAHSGVDDGDCTTKLVCECGYVIKDAKDSHEYEETLSYNENGHYHKCKNCDQTTSVEEHSGVDDGDCTTKILCECGYVIKEAKDSHEYEEAFLYNETGHYHKCKNCDQTSIVEEHSGVDDGDCTTKLVCECGYVIKDAKDNHEYEETLSYNETGHYHKCKNCDQTTSVEGHSGVDDGDCTTKLLCECGYVIKDARDSHTGGHATCTEKAKCEVCSKEYCELAFHVSNRDADCENASICTVCGKVLEEKKGHEYVDGICKVCNHKDNIYFFNKIPFESFTLDNLEQSFEILKSALSLYKDLTEEERNKCANTITLLESYINDYNVYVKQNNDYHENVISISFKLIETGNVVKVNYAFIPRKKEELI